MTHLRNAIFVVTALGLLALSGSSQAADGRVELSHHGALAGIGIGADIAGYPITLSVPGSYILTSDLVQPDANTHVIEIDADDVYIDLNGFALRGSNTCNKDKSPTCTGSGSGKGIDGETAARVRVYNGVVRGMGSDGIKVGDQGQVLDVVAADNGVRGVSVGKFGLVSRVSAFRNDFIGIATAEASVVVDSTVAENDADGMYARGVVQRCTARNNEGDGIYMPEGLIKSSFAEDNSDYGFYLNSSGVVSDSVARNNGGWSFRTSQGPASSSKPGVVSSASSHSGGQHFNGSWLNLGTNVCNAEAPRPARSRRQPAASRRIAVAPPPGKGPISPRRGLGCQT